MMTEDLLTPDEFETVYQRARMVRNLRRRFDWLSQKRAAIHQDLALGRRPAGVGGGDKHVDSEWFALKWALSILEPFAKEMHRRQLAIKYDLREDDDA